MEYKMKNKETSSAFQYLLLLQVLELSLLAASHEWYSEVDHYWPLNELGYGSVYDFRRFVHGRWHGTVKGEAEITWLSPRLALSLNGKDAWLYLGMRQNSCYIDVHHCNSTGFTVAIWVNFRADNMTQGVLQFGGGDCGLSIIRTHTGRINCTMKSVELKRTWNLQSVERSLVTGLWHHLAISWNSTTEKLHLYINGTRLENVSTDMMSNATCGNTYCKCDWSMKVGTHLFHNGSSESYSSMKLAKIALWSEVVSNETIQEASNDMRGLYTSNRGCYGSWLAHMQFCYRIQPSWKQTWYDAKKTCERYLASLVSIGSHEEYRFFERALHKIKASSCVHIGLHTHEADWPPFWVDGNLWGFSKLNASSLPNRTHSCVQRYADGLWYMNDCNEKCGFVCKKYRAGLFRNAEFQCRVTKRNYKLVGHRVAIRLVEDELSCGIDCLIYGGGCKSYNYHPGNHAYSAGQNICELNRSNQEKTPQSLLPSQGYQYCERV